MKKRILAAAAAVVVAISANAQSTADSIASKYKLLPMPGAKTQEQTFPVLGSYQLTGATEGTGAITVSLDPANKGIVWVEGLPQGKVKAYLKKSPTTYRIMPQKSESGKQVQEGTLHYDTTSHELHIALGKPYNDADPVAVFAGNSGTMQGTSADEAVVTKVKPKTAASKTKTKVEYYTATKLMPESMMAEETETQVSDSTQQQ